MYKVFAGQRPPVDLASMPEGFRKLLESCWAADPSQRPGFREILGRLRQLLSEERQRRFQARLGASQHCIAVACICQASSGPDPSVLLGFGLASTRATREWALGGQTVAESIKQAVACCVL